MFTVVIPFWNGHQYLDKLLMTIPEAIPVVIVDDVSDTSITDVNRPNTQVKRLTKKGYFTGAVNEGIASTGTDVLVLNQDTYFADDSWLNFVDEQRQRYGIFGERAGTHPAWPNRYIHGTFMYIQRDVIDTVGLMDADTYPLWGSTCEYQLRACRKGFKANPVKNIPGFVHERQGPYGSAIKKTLEHKPKGQMLRTPPMISVIITCYNHGRYLPDAINSLIGGKTSLGQVPGQTLQSFEIIIVDDGSTDDSAAIAEKLADPWKGIHLVRQSNKGSAAAMNTGIIASHTRQNSLIAVLDGDDMMETGRLKRMVKAHNDNPGSVVYDNIRYFGNGQRGIVTDWQTGKTIDKLDLGTYNFERLLYKNAMHKGLLYPKKAWEEAGGYPSIMDQGREDWAFNVALGVKGWCGVNTGKYDYLYRREWQNRTLRNTTPKHYKIFLDQIKSIFPNIYTGERPMGCCGRPSAMANSRKRGTSVTSSKNLVGEEGMVVLEYTGNNAGDETWNGKYGRYVLGGVRKRGYVDKRDAETLLNIREGGQNLFRKAKQEPKSAEIQTVSVDTTESLPDWELEKEAPDVTDMTIRELLKINLSTWTTIQLENALKTEKKGKNRSTAVSLIEDELNGRLA